MSDFNIVFSEDEELKLSFSDVVQVASNTHNELSGRGNPDAHPIDAITGLKDKLDDLEQSAESIDEIETKVQELEQAKVTSEEREAWNNKSRVFRNASGALVITR